MYFTSSDKLIAKMMVPKQDIKPNKLLFQTEGWSQETIEA